MKIPGRVNDVERGARSRDYASRHHRQRILRDKEKKKRKQNQRIEKKDASTSKILSFDVVSSAIFSRDEVSFVSYILVVGGQERRLLPKEGRPSVSPSSSARMRKTAVMFGRQSLCRTTGDSCRLAIWWWTLPLPRLPLWSGWPI